MSNPTSSKGWNQANWGDEIQSKEFLSNASSFYKFVIKYWYSTDVTYDIT